MAPRLSQSDSERSDAANQRRLRRLSRKVEDVKEGIVKCIDLYMSKNRAVVFLYLERDIEPHITELVWDELDKQNPEFFRAYKVNLALIKRIARFNNSLESHKTVTSAPHANGTSSTSKGPTGMEQPPTSASMNHSLSPNYNNSSSMHDPLQNGIRSASVNPNGMVQSPLSAGMNCPLSSNHGHHASICGPLQNGHLSSSVVSNFMMLFHIFPCNC